MKVHGIYSFNAPVDVVWNTIQSPEALSGCIPGCESFESDDQNSYKVSIKLKVASITGKYTGEVKITDDLYPDTYTMTVEGQGQGGTVKASGVFLFKDHGTVTEVTVQGDAQVSGMIARVGQRILGGASKMLMNQFFSCLSQKVEKR